MLDRIRTLAVAHRRFLLYGFISVFVTLVDVVVCRISERFINPVAANTLGVVVGFVIQYFLTSKHVYNTKNMKSFLIFLATFFAGLALANTIVYVCREHIFHGADDAVAFSVSKGASIVIPFFFTYFLRKRFMPYGGGKNA